MIFEPENVILRPESLIFSVFFETCVFFLAGSAYKRIGKRVMKPAQRGPMSTKLCMHLDMIKIKSFNRTRPHGNLNLEVVSIKIRDQSFMKIS